MEDKIQKLQDLVTKSQKIVFFGGAGVSTESGIPDFRSVDGLYNQKWDYPPEEILSGDFFYDNPKEFYRFYREKLLMQGRNVDIKPNAAHYKLAELEKAGKLIGIVTQNIDGLHQKAGSEKVFELHGSILRNYCTKCHEFYDDVYVREHADAKGIPLCEKCGAKIKPDVVLYGESLVDRVVEGALKAITNADLLIIGGTSLTVYPAAGFVRYYSGKDIVLINRDETQNDDIASLVIHDSIGRVLERIKV